MVPVFNCLMLLIKFFILISCTVAERYAFGKTAVLFSPKKPKTLCRHLFQGRQVAADAVELRSGHYTRLYNSKADYG